MISASLAIVDEVLKRFKDNPRLNEVEVDPAGDPSVFPCLFVTDMGHETPRHGTEPGVTRYSMRLSIEVYVQGPDPAELRLEIDALYLDVIEQMLLEPPLGGLVEDVNEGAMRRERFRLAEETRLGFAIDFEIIFAAARHRPVAQSH